MGFKFCVKLQEPSFQIEVRVNQTFFSLSVIIRGMKIRSNFNEIRFTLGFFGIHIFAPIIFFYTLIALKFLWI